MISIAIDGPSGSGKSSISKCLAKKLGFINMDTGALYRGIAYFLLKNAVNYKDEYAVTETLDNLKIELKYLDDNQRVIVNSEDITEFIRSDEVSLVASSISSIPSVRQFLLNTQRQAAKENNIIMDGRDIGTVVLPDADLKIFLSASPQVRAFRRYKQLLSVDENTKYDDVLEAINNRDFSDINRKESPLKCAEDAVVFDNSEYKFEESIEALLKIIKERINFETK